MMQRVFNLRQGLQRLALVMPLVALVIGACVTIGDDHAIFPFAALAFVIAVWVVATLYLACRVIQWVINGFWNPRIDGFVQEELDAHIAHLRGAEFCIRDMDYDVSEGAVALRFERADGEPGMLVIRNVSGCDVPYRCDAGEAHRVQGVVVDHRKDLVTLWASDTFSVRLKLNPAAWDVTLTSPASRP